jgi:hypothetical protein
MLKLSFCEGSFIIVYLIRTLTELSTALHPRVSDITILQVDGPTTNEKHETYLQRSYNADQFVQSCNSANLLELQMDSLQNPTH